MNLPLSFWVLYSDSIFNTVRLSDVDKCLHSSGVVLLQSTEQ
jgi:hypothetical protein